VAGAIAENGMAVSELLRRRIGAYFGSEARGLSRPLLPTKSISPPLKKGGNTGRISRLRTRKHGSETSLLGRKIPVDIHNIRII
jgi:hypothetical protein